MTEQRLPLGAIGRDTISKFTGVVVARTEWLHGCVSITLQPQAMHEGVPGEAQSFDEAQVLLQHKSYLEPDPAGQGQDPGDRPAGPRPDPVRHPDPVR